MGQHAFQIRQNPEGPIQLVRRAVPSRLKPRVRPQRFDGADRWAGPRAGIRSTIRAVASGRRGRRSALFLARSPGGQYAQAGRFHRAQTETGLSGDEPASYGFPYLKSLPSPLFTYQATCFGFANADDRTVAHERWAKRNP